MLATIALYALVARRFPYTGASGDSRALQDPLDYVALWLSFAATGFSEEVVCRAYLITRLERLRRSSAQAVVVSALLFASYHLYQGWHGGLYALFVGLLYGCVFLLVRRVWPLAMGHILFNIYLTT